MPTCALEVARAAPDGVTKIEAAVLLGLDRHTIARHELRALRKRKARMLADG